MARDKNIARKLSLINPDNEERLNRGDAHGLVQLARLDAPDGPSSDAISLGGGSYSQNFDSLTASPLNGTSTSLPTDWFFSEALANANTTYGINNGVNTAGNTYSYGDDGSSDRAFGSLRSGSLISTIGASFTNSTGGIINSLLINYTGEQWRLGATGRNDRLDFEISFNATSLTTGTWVAVDGLDFIAPVSTGTAGALNGNANSVSVSFNITQLTIASGATFWIRWVDFDATGSDDGLAIDNFTLATPGALAINDVALNEGDAGSTAFTFTVTRSGGSSGAVGATWTITGAGSGDLAAGQLLTGTVSFANGEISRTITVNVAGDYFIESDETFTVTLSAPTGGATISDATGIGTITNDDVRGAVSIDDVSHMEGDGGTTLYTFTVSRTGQADGASVQWTLGAPGGAGYAGATDFPSSQALSGVIAFAGGETSRTIIVSVLGDHVYEPDETFTLTLSNPSVGTTIADGTGIGAILNDDDAPPFTPGGNEATVNQNTDQDQIGPRVAWIDAGHYVVTWTSHETPTSYEVMARLFNADGTPAGDEFQVNTTSAGDQVGNRVAALSGGGFVIVWSDVATTDIRAQMFNADGSPDGIELLLNTDPNAQSVPWVSALPGGGFAAVWMHNDGVSYDIRGRTFDSDGQPASAEFAVNTETALNQQYAQMTTLANGHFVVVWHDASGVGGDASGTAIKMRVFASDGTALTAETLVNTTVSGIQQFPAVGALVGGGYVVAWEDNSLSPDDNSGNALRAQIYDASGNAVGGEFLVNATTYGYQARPTIAGLPDGGFLIGWWNQNAGHFDNEIRALAFDALGNRRGGEFEVNSDSAGDQLGPAFAVSPVDGHLVAAWNDFNDSQELTDGEIEQRLFTLDFQPRLSVGNLVFLDANNNGVFDAGDSGIDGVTVELRNGAGGGLVATTVTGGGGLYSFTGLYAGDYYLLVDAGELPPGLVGIPIATDPDDDVDNDNNGVFGPIIGTPVFTLSLGGEPDIGVDGNGTDSNFTVDLGFVYAPPTIDLDLSGGGTGFATDYIEGDAGVPIVDVDVEIVSAGPVDSVTITLTDARDGDGLFLSGLPAGEDISVSAYDEGTGTIIVYRNGATLAELQEALRHIHYRNTGINPTVDGTDPERSISFVVNSAAGASNTAVTIVEIAAVDTPATIGGTATGDILEDTITATGGQLTISDPDGPDSFVAFGPAAGSGGYGSFYLTESGAWTYEADNAAIQFLGQGDTATDTIDAVAADGTVQALTVTLTGVNDAAAIDGDDTGEVTEDSEAPATGTLNVSDADDGESSFQAQNSAATAYGTFSIAANGTWSYQLDNMNAAVQALDTGQSMTDTIEVRAFDGTRHAVVITINGVDEPVAAAPVVDLDGGAPGIHYSGSFTEGGAAGIGASIQVIQGTFPITSATITLTDALAGDSLSITGSLPPGITNVGSSATQIQLVGIGISAAQWAAALGQIAFASSSDNPDLYGTDAARTINVEVSDGVTISATATATIAIEAVNDAPIVGALNGDSVLWTEGDPYVLLDQNMPATVFDPDNQNFAGGFLSVGVQVNPRAEDEFFVLDIFPGVGTIGNQVYVDGAHIGTITSAGPGQILTIGFNAEATAERVATLLDYIAYRNVAGDAPSTGPRSVTYLLNDGHSGASGGVVTVDVAAVNDAPVVTTTAGTTAYAESVNSAPGTVAVNNALTVTDADDIALLGARVSITGNYQLGQDILAFTNNNAAIFGNISAFYNVGTGVLTLTSAGASATLAQWQAALRAVTYSNSSEEPSQATRTISFVVNDGDADSVAATRLLSVTAQNDSPSGADAIRTINEDSTFTFTNAHFGFSDVDGDALLGVRFGAAPVGGTLYFDADGAGGNAPVAITSFPTTTILASDIALGRLSFVPTANLNGTGAASVSFTVVDNGGTVGAGQNADLTPNTLTFNITSVNDAPSGADSIITIAEDGAHILQVADFGFSDPDGNAFEAVIFSNVTGGTLYINGNPYTNVTLVYLHTIQSGGIVFVPAANATGPTGSITFTVRDDGGFDNGGQAADTTPNTLTFSMTPVNDAPTVTIAPPAALEATEQVALSLKNSIAIGDVDSGAGVIVVNLQVDYGLLNVVAGDSGVSVSGNGTSMVRLTGTLAQIQSLLGGNPTTAVDYLASTDTPPAQTILTVQVNDSGNSGSGGALQASDSETIVILARNDAPDGTGKTITVTEDTPKTLSAADFPFTDVEGNGLLSVTIVTLPGSGTLYYDADGPGGAGLPMAVVAGTTFTPAQLSGARLTYVPAPNASGNGAASFTYTVRDNGGTANGGQDTDPSPATIVFNVTPVNDAPSSTGLDGDSAAYDEDLPAGAVWLDVGRDALVTDLDSADFAGGSLTVAIIINKAAGEDQLVLDTASNGVTMVGSEIFVDSISVGTISADGVGLDRVITFNSGATAALVSRLIQNFSYFNTNQGTPSTAQRLVEFRLADGDGATMFAHTTIAVTAVDDAPVIANFDHDDVTFIEGSAAIRIDLGGDALVTDIDSMDFDGGYLQVVLGEGVPSEDVIGFATGAETGITLSDGTNTGSIVSIGGIAVGTIVTGSPSANSFTVNFNANADAADVTALLRAITYLNTNTDHPATLTRGIAVFVNDGDGSGPVGAASNVHVTRVNDAPVNGVPGTQGLNEDASLTLSTANGNALSVADVDATTLTVTLAVAHGTLTLAGTAGLTFSGGSDGTADASMTFSGTAAAINAALGAGLTYNPNANFNGGDAISVVTTDGGQTGTGPVGTDSDSVPISITAVNDAPAGADAAFTINEDSTFTFAESHFGFTDPVEGDDFLGIVIATIPGAGTLLYDGVAVTAGQFVSLQDIALGRLTFAPAADANGAPYGGFTFQVRDDGGTGNGGQDTDQSPNSVTFNVTAVNDAPTNSVPGGQTINEDSSLTLSTGNGNAISVADVDAATLTVTLSVAHGTLTIASTLGLTFSGGSDGTADASMTFSGTAAAINTALGAGLTYNPNADFNGSDAISVVTTDGGQTGTGPVGTDSDSIAVGITAVNDAPSGTSATITLNEDGTRILAQADFGFSDPVEGHGFAGVVITTLPTNGTLLLNGAALLVAETFVSAAQLAAGQLVFQPDADANGAAYATLTFQVRDDGGTASGGQDTDQSADTLTFAVAAINDSPVVDLNGAGGGTSATLNYSENGAATAIAPGGAIIDIDTSDFGGGSLWVTMTNGLNAEDMLSILNQGTGAGQVGYANGLITYEGVTIADLLPTLGAPVPVLDIRFRSNVAVSQAAVQAVLQAVAYHNISQDPSTTPRNVSFSFNDGDGNPAGGDPPGTATATINVASVNDAPSGTSATIAVDEDGSRVLTQADFGFSDPAEGDAFAGVLLTSLPASGTLLLNGVAVTVVGIFVSAAQLAAGQLVFAPGLNGNGAGYASFNFAVRDDGGTANGGQDTDQSPNTITFNVAAINDAPAGADAAIVINEDNGRVLTAADFGFGDTADGDAFAGVVLTSLPTAGFLIYDPDGPGGLPGVLANVGRFITAAELAMGALTYYPASHANGAASASFTFQVRDNGGTGNGGQDTDQSPNTITFNINPVNDAPSGADKSITGSEDDPYVFTAADFGFSDPVEGNGFFAVRIATLPTAGDVLLNGVAVMAGDFIAVSAINAGMLTFQPDPDAFGAPYASFTFQVQDNGGTAYGGVDTDQTPNTITITITPDNLAPVLDLDAGAAGVDAALAYTENNPATRISPNATLTDDSADFAGGTIVAHFTANGAAEDQLSILSGGGIAVSSTDDTLFYGGVLIGSWGGGANGADLVVQLNANATAAAVEAVLRAIAYANLSDAPSVLARTIDVAVSDGDGGAASAHVTVNLTAVDDAAVARNDAFAIDETAMLSSNVFLDHGAGADGDVDGPGLAVSAVNGSSVHVGQQIQLTSGALLTLNADGSFTYATNHAFDPTPTGSSGASNTPAADHFTYTLAGGGTATVTLAIAGLDSDDTLLGTAGADVLAGGNGNDSYRVENASDLVIESIGGGQDGIYVAMNLGAYALAAGSEVEILSAIDPASAVAMNLTGNEFANILIGTAGSNTLIGGGAADILIGGAGNDFYRVEEAGDSVVEGAGGGFDSVYAVGSYTLAAGSEVELLSAIDPASSAAMNLTGNEYANLIYGNAAGNTLIGGAGNDTLFGGAGNDFYRVETAGDIVVEYAGGGFDSVYAVESYTLAAGSEVELLSAIDPASSAAMNLTGNDYANLIYGNAGVNVLIGGGGADTLIGGGGNDFYRVEEAGDAVVEAIGGGSDAVYATSSYALTAGSEIELLSAIDPGATAAMDLTGNDFANTIIGTAGANTLIGGGGNDVLAGGLGNDVYRVEDVGDAVLEYGGGGADAVYAVGSYALQDGYEIEVLAAIDPASAAALNLTGNNLGNTLFGNAGANVLDGKGGNDALVGGGGADIFAFTTALGAGNVDTIIDFVSGTDKIGLDDAIFAAIGGSLNADAFVIGATAAGTEDRIVYNQATGQLFYDADGSGGGAAILFATLQGAPVLSASDFTMI